MIAIDPDAPPPGRPRWFALDTRSMHARLARSPALIHWVERTDDLEAALRDYSGTVDIVSFSRGPYRWRMGVPPDGRRPGKGREPTLIQWQGDLHPAQALPVSGCRLERFDAAIPSAAFSTPSGMRTIS